MFSGAHEDIGSISGNSLYLTAAQGAAEFCFNFRIANLNWNDN